MLRHDSGYEDGHRRRRKDPVKTVEFSTVDTKRNHDVLQNDGVYKDS